MDDIASIKMIDVAPTGNAFNSLQAAIKGQLEEVNQEKREKRRLEGKGRRGTQLTAATPASSDA